MTMREPRRSGATRPNNLPARLTTFVGRERELAEAAALLQRTRLLTLSGAGGTGKTRLALELASAVLPSYRDGAFLVQLAPIFDPELVVLTTAQVLGVPDVLGRPPIDRLRDYLRDRRLLLILDNFEQVLEAGPQLVTLLGGCPALTLLVTSRVALRVSGEQELAVPPLGLPELAVQPPGGPELVVSLGRSPALRLFLDRARAVQANFDLTEQNAAAVAEICRRVDGLPLAIELAAARVRIFSPATMLSRLASGGREEATASDADERAPVRTQRSSLEFLTGGARDLPARQRTLRDTIAWSYELLEPDEQALFRRLAVFRGGCSLETALKDGATKAVGDPRWGLAEDEVVGGLESLVTTNLLRRLDASPEEPRLAMLETIREYALERLGEAGELQSMRDWHAGYFLELAEAGEPELRGPDERRWLDRLEREHDNLRAALECTLARTGGAERALRLVAALAWFWGERGYVAEGRRWLGRALAAPGRTGGRLRALQGAGWLAHIQRDSAAARAPLEESLELARVLGDRSAEAWSLHLLGRVAYFDGDAVTARSLGEACLALARELGDRWLIAWALHLLGLAAHISADYPAARSLYEQSQAIRRELGYWEGIGICQVLLAMVAYREGDHEAAMAASHESLRIMREVGSRWTVHNALVVSAAEAAMHGQEERAVRLAGAIAAYSETVDVTPIPLAEGILEEALRQARLALPAQLLEEAWLAGRALAFDDAVAEALAVEPGARQPETRPAHQSPAGLSRRELEVLRLIAAGRTTREVAEALVVSVPTVERHITHIYMKIGARGRAEATAFALKHGLD
jgi:predicted ATPase/DNA-binding CsgD family transcriptional regulator